MRKYRIGMVQIQSLLHFLRRNKISIQNGYTLFRLLYSYLKFTSDQLISFSFVSLEMTIPSSRMALYSVFTKEGKKPNRQTDSKNDKGFFRNFKPVDIYAYTIGIGYEDCKKRKLRKNSCNSSAYRFLCLLIL